MKILLATLLLGALGAGSFLFASSNPTAVRKASPQACEATVECTPAGTCVVTCHKPDGTSCSMEIACDGGNCHVVGCNPPPDCAQSCQPGCK